MFTNAGRVVVTLLLAFFCCCAVSEGAAAQTVLPSLVSEALQPDFSSRDLMHFDQDLDLDSGQRAVLRNMFSEYQAAFSEGTSSLREQLQQAHPSFAEDEQSRQRRLQEMRDKVQELLDEVHQPVDGANPEEAKAMRERIRQRAEAIREQYKLEPKEITPSEFHRAMKSSLESLDRWQAEKAALRDRFVQDIQTFLREDQRSRCPELERKLLRLKEMPHGKLSGESVDVTVLLDDPELSAPLRQSHGIGIDDYAIGLDEVLQARQHFAAGLPGKFLSIMNDAGEIDSAKLDHIIEEQVSLHVKVRDVNEQRVAAIAATLPDEVARELESAFRKRGYPRIFRWTHAHRVFNAALELEGLPPATLESVKALQAECVDELRSVNAELLKIIRDEEPLDLKARLREQWHTQAMTDAKVDRASVHSSKAVAAFTKRAQIEQSYLDRLEQLLPKEMFDKLPHFEAPEARIHGSSSARDGV